MRLVPQMALIAVLGLVLAATVGCTGTTPTSTGGAAAIAQKKCPVTGDPINPNIYVDYNGRRVYFCCEMCPPKFNKDPEKYLKILDEQMKAGADEKVPSVTQTTGTVTHVAYWTCPMHPEVKADKPGKCPKCGMTLVPVPESEPKMPTTLPPASGK